MDEGAWWATVHGVAKSQTRLKHFTFTFHFSLSCIGEGNGNLLQCSCLENPRDREGWWATVYGVAQSRTRLKRLSSSSSSKITADGDCSHEIKRRLLLRRKVMINLDSIFKSRDITLPTKVHLVNVMIFPMVMYGFESWTVKKAKHHALWCLLQQFRVKSRTTTNFFFLLHNFMDRFVLTIVLSNLSI